MALILASSFNGFGQNSTRILSTKLEYTISVVNGELDIQSKETIDKLVSSMSNALSYELKESVMTDEFTSIDEIKAYTLISKEGKKPKKIKVNSTSTEDYVSRGIFYSNTKRTIITFPGVQEGAILHSEVTLHHVMPELLSPFYFDSYMECDVAELVITVDDDMDMRFIENYFGFGDHIKMDESRADGKIVYHWKGSNFESRFYENDSGGSSCYAPHLIFRLASYKVKGESKYVLRNKEDLFKWYSTLIKDQELAEEYTPVLDSLKANSATDLILAENIFNWVQHHVNYVAYEDGLGGFIPRTPNSVIKNRFGDCKDMAMLTKTMMNKCGLECYIAWVGTRSKCYTYDDCPTPIVDNHMIAAYPSEDGIIFIDPTSTYSVFGYPSSFIQGKEAMVRKSPEEFEIITVPFIDNKINYSSDIYQVEIVGDQIKGTAEQELNGYEKIEYEYRIAYKSVSMDELFTSMNDIGNESFRVKDLKQENFNSNKGTLESKYSYLIDNYVSSYNGAVYINPFLKNVIDIDVGERHLDLVMEYKYSRGVEVVINLKPNAKVETTITNESITENGLSLEIKYERIDNSLVINYVFTSDNEVITSVDFESIRLTIKKMRKKLKQQVEIKYED